MQTRLYLVTDNMLKIMTICSVVDMYVIDNIDSDNYFLESLPRILMLKCLVENTSTKFTKAFYLIYMQNITQKSPLIQI